MESPEELNQAPVRIADIVTTQQDLPILREVDKRLVEAKSSPDIILWTRVRKEIDRQLERRENAAHERREQTKQRMFRRAMTVGVFLTGVAFLVPTFGINLTFPGLFMIGSAIFGLIPDQTLPGSKRLDGDEYE